MPHISTKQTAKCCKGKLDQQVFLGYNNSQINIKSKRTNLFIDEINHIRLHLICYQVKLVFEEFK